MERESWANTVRRVREGQAQLQVRFHDLSRRGLGRVQRGLGRASTWLPPTPLGAVCGVFDSLPLTAENVLLGYAQGIYAMDFDGKARWHCPPDRFIIYLKELRISANMRRELKRCSYTVTFDRAPREVLDECAAERGNGEGTWLSERMKRIYLELFEMGAMHTVEAWQDGVLVGGSFGVSIGRVWTSESMFHRAPHAGKVQFAAAAAHLIERGFEIVDGQQYSEHFARFGARDVPIAEYRSALARGLANPAQFHPGGVRPPLGPPSAEDAPASTKPAQPAGKELNGNGKKPPRPPSGGSRNRASLV
ncbi:MAG TPA: leucyl/phenylalanyl-tRNA--protein transferase [Polyangiaceae bacterium]|nr:leucyl/phenylalanyl-tRNA--protein transferase [Polyangiaceae bacterium]